jgi:peptide/nickel transport system substrate-binding protein
LGGVLLAACGGNTGGPPAPAFLSNYSAQKGTFGGQLVFSDWEPVQDLNVISSSAATTQQVASGPIWSSLWVPDGQNKMYPDLVSEIPSTQNGDVKKIDDAHMDITIKLRPGLKWSDGSPLTTADVDFTLKAICDPETGATSTLGFDHIQSTTIVSDSVMVWHFGPNKAGTCGLTSDLSSGIYSPYLLLGQAPMTPVPKSVLGNVAHKDWATSAYFTQKPTVTSGPYMVQDFTPGPAAIVTLVPNPHYADGRSGQFFGHRPYLDKLTYKIYGDKSSQIAGIKSGDTDLGLDLIAKDLPALGGWSGGRAVYANGLLDEFLNFNLGNNTTGCDAQQFAATCGTPTPWQNDKVLRQAIGLAVDKDAMNKQLVQGIGKTMNDFMVSTLSPYYDTTTPAFHRDVARANQMLDQDGWIKGSDGIRVKNGHKLSWTLSTTSGNPQRAAEEELLISNWKDIGAQVTTKNFPAGIFFADFHGGGVQATGQFDMALYANNWGPDPDSWATTILPGQIPSAQNPAGVNWNRVNDPKLTDLFTKGEQEIDITKRVDLYKQAQVEWRDFLPTIELYERPDVFGVDNLFQNFNPTVNTCLATCNAPDWFHKGAS